MYSIYIIKCKCGETYIGSTGNLKHRFEVHKSYFDNGKNRKIYNHFRTCCKSWDELTIEVLDEIQDKEQSKLREDELIQEYKCSLNQFRASPIERKEYYELNKERENKRAREYYQKNKEKIKEWNAKSVEKHKEKRIAWKKQQTTCECGGTYTNGHKSRHFKTKKHLEFKKPI